MKKLTTVGHYLSDEEISLLYGFRGLRQRPIRFVCLILKIRDQRLRRLLFSGAWKMVREYGNRLLTKGELLHLMTGKYAVEVREKRSPHGRSPEGCTAHKENDNESNGA
jgi:hypothetical protein